MNTMICILIFLVMFSTTMGTMMTNMLSTIADPSDDEHTYVLGDVVHSGPIR